MPMGPGTHHPSVSQLTGAILCRRKQQPFDEIDDGNHCRLFYSSRSRKNDKKQVKTSKQQRRHNNSQPKDIFCSIPVEDLDQQGVFAVRDVLVTEKPLYEFPPKNERNLVTTEEERVAERPRPELLRHRTLRRRKQQVQSISRPPQTSRNARNDSGDTFENSLTDWSNFLDILLPNLCVADEDLKKSSRIHRSSPVSSAHAMVASPNNTRVGASSCGSPGSSSATPSSSSSFNHKHRTTTFQKVEQHRSPNRHHAPPPASNSSQSSSPSVVYPIAKYPSQLNNRHLVEQRRLSLREHLTFRPVLLPSSYVLASRK